MITLKFGGTSVANAENIKLVLAIINQKAQTEKLAVIVSALSGVTDILLDASKKSALKLESYKSNIELIKEKHFEAIAELIDSTNQNQLLIKINHQINQLQTLLDGCFLLGELSARTSDAVVSFGELLSSQIIATALQQKMPNSTFKDSRELIKTNSNFGKAVINYTITNKNIAEFFESNKSQVIILPGFIASDDKNNTTTLGRGGSDFTSAIIANASNSKSGQTLTECLQQIQSW
ncbi:MAG: aspartokinase/homoserine dehydrogenase 1 [Flavobacterium sp.]|jgi:aspartokinase/homoserine dehydrogenase 1